MARSWPSAQCCQVVRAWTWSRCSPTEGSMASRSPTVSQLRSWSCAFRWSALRERGVRRPGRPVGGSVRGSPRPGRVVAGRCGGRGGRCAVAGVGRCRVGVGRRRGVGVLGPRGPRRGAGRLDRRRLLPPPRPAHCRRWPRPRLPRSAAPTVGRHGSGRRGGRVGRRPGLPGTSRGSRSVASALALLASPVALTGRGCGVGWWRGCRRGRWRGSSRGRRGPRRGRGCR